jgi:hypothetical protein
MKEGEKMNVLTILALCFITMLAWHIISWRLAEKRHMKEKAELVHEYHVECNAWKQERNDLLDKFAKERSELIDRITAVDYVEYKAMNKSTKKKEGEEKPKPVEYV